MPFTMGKNSGGGFTVSSPNGLKAKNTTKKKAQGQIKILNAKKAGKDFVEPYSPDNMKPRNPFAKKKAF